MELVAIFGLYALGLVLLTVSGHIKNSSNPRDRVPFSFGRPPVNPWHGSVLSVLSFGCVVVAAVWAGQFMALPIVIAFVLIAQVPMFVLNVAHNKQVRDQQPTES